MELNKFLKPQNQIEDEDEVSLQHIENVQLREANK